MSEIEKISIIVPAYNVEEYITKCINSILNQTYKNIEIIIINDGSTDRTLDIVKELQKYNECIKVINQDNSGAGVSRNNGIKNANGEFIMFVDADDWIDKKMLERYITIENETGADLITSSYIEENYYKNKYLNSSIRNVERIFLSDERKTKNLYIKMFLKELVVAPHRILYKKDLITKYNIVFPDIRRSQDIVFNYNYYEHINSIYVDDNIYYHYRIDESNYVQKIKKEYIETLKMLYNDICQKLKDWETINTEEDLKNFNNKFLVMVGYYIEARVIEKEKYSIIFDDDTIHKIIINSKPLDMYHKILKYSICNRNKILISLIINIKLYVKKHFRVIFQKIRKIKKY